MIVQTLIVSAFAIVAVSAHCDREIVKPVEWTGGNFGWPNQATKSIYQASGRFIQKNAIATRAQIYRDDVIVALPRYKPGVPATLARLSLKHRGCEATLTPFPCWTTQEEGNCNALQSVVDIFADPNDILWVLDVGVVNTLDTPIRRCPPKVVAISLRTGKLVKTLDLSGLVAQASRLQYIAVEYACDGRPFAYVSDAATRSVLVFDVAGNRGYRVVLPKAVAPGKRDVLYIALIHKGNGNNFLMLTYLSSAKIFMIRTDYLRAGCTEGKIIDHGTKDGKIIILGTDLGTAVFFRYEGKPEVYRWDASLPLAPGLPVLVYKSPKCYLSTHALADLKRERMRLLESNFPDFIQNTVGCGASQRITLMGGCVNRKNPLPVHT
ncbi:MRJP domain containing protein [Asbolus verrucosus]|uniref:MRJP domain containing protein n=1 Tax=Asbolus verrucosus TaxID=1661398 RepID=A0A482W1M2_ASBVE|nr:MRJP domain containing protein [Asbolus verrucosus]